MSRAKANADEPRKATAIAYPMQGLIKYHGLRDEALRLPFHDSISVCTAPIHTRTTVAFGARWRDTATVDGQRLGGREYERVLAVIDAVRRRAKLRLRFRMASENDFPANVGLGASASGFAALAVAAAEAAGLELSQPELSALARRGAGSAARAVTGGFSRWRMGTGDEDSYAYQLAGEELQMGIVVALIPAYKRTEDAHREVLSSPFFHSRLSYVHEALAEMEAAIRRHDIEAIGQLAERDSLILHGITMTGEEEMILWRPETVQAILEVKRLRQEHIPAYFSIDTGATVYVNTDPRHVAQVERRIRALGLRTLRCHVGGPAHLVSNHLF